MVGATDSGGERALEASLADGRSERGSVRYGWFGAWSAVYGVLAVELLRPLLQASLERALSIARRVEYINSAGEHLAAFEVRSMWQSTFLYAWEILLLSALPIAAGLVAGRFLRRWLRPAGLAELAVAALVWAVLNISRQRPAWLAEELPAFWVYTLDSLLVIVPFLLAVGLCGLLVALVGRERLASRAWLIGLVLFAVAYGAATFLVFGWGEPLVPGQTYAPFSVAAYGYSLMMEARTLLLVAASGALAGWEYSRLVMRWRRQTTV